MTDNEINVFIEEMLTSPNISSSFINPDLKLQQFEFSWRMAIIDMSIKMLKVGLALSLMGGLGLMVFGTTVFTSGLVLAALCFVASGLLCNLTGSLIPPHPDEPGTYRMSAFI